MSGARQSTEKEGPEWSKPELVDVLRQAGFLELAAKVTGCSAMDYEVESALRVILLHRRIPYVHLSMSAPNDHDRYQRSFGINHEVALRNPEVERFQKSLPKGVVMFHVHPNKEPVEPEFGPGWVIVVQAHKYGFILEEYYTLVRAD